MSKLIHFNVVVHLKEGTIEKTHYHLEKSGLIKMLVEKHSILPIYKLVIKKAKEL